MSHRILHQSLSMSSPFLTALIVTAVAVTALALAFSYWRRAASADRYLVLSIALMAPLIAAGLSATPIPASVRALLGPDSTAARSAPTIQRLEVASVATPSSEVACILFMIWVAGVLAFAVLATRQAARWRNVARRSLPVTDPRVPAMRTPVTTSPAAAEPMVVGVVRPSIVLPPDYIDALDEDELRAVFTHELEHVRRRDNLHAVLHEIVTALFWFEPLHWIARRRLLELRERACDERVLAAGCHPRHYVSALAKSCHVAVESAAIACMSGFHIRERIESIMSYSSRRTQFVSAVSVRTLSIGLAILVAGGFAMTAPSPSFAAEGTWRLTAEVHPVAGGEMQVLVTVFSPENVIVSRNRTTARSGVPLDMTSSYGRYVFKINVNPPSDKYPGDAILEVREGETVVHRASGTVTMETAERTVSLNIKDASLKDFVSAFSLMSGRKIIVDPSLQGTVSIDVTDTPWDIALGEAIAPLGLVAETRGNEIHIVAAKAPRLDMNTMTPPKVLTRVEPIYPPEAREAKVGGVVVVEALVDETGVVRETRLVKSQPMGLGEAAVTAVRQWTFTPAMKDGNPIAVMFNVTINFKTEKT